MVRLVLLPFRLLAVVAGVAVWVAIVPFVEALRSLRLRATGHRPEPVLDLHLD